MYQGLDFNDQFFTLTLIEDGADKATPKLVMAEPVVLTFSPVGMSDMKSGAPQSSDATSCQSSGSQDTILISPKMKVKRHTGPGHGHLSLNWQPFLMM